MSSENKNFPKNYDYKLDLDYLFFVKKTFTLFDTKKLKTFNNYSIHELYKLIYDDYKKNEKNEEWKNYLDNKISPMVYLFLSDEEEEENQANMKIKSIFMNYGIYMKIFNGDNNERFIFFVIPPFLSLYWDSYYKLDFLSENVMNKIIMTPAIYNINEWKENIESFLTNEISNKNPKLKESIENIIEIMKLIFNTETKNAYIPVFASCSNDEQFLLTINVIFHITKTIFEMLKEDKVYKLKPSFKLSLKEIKKIKNENIQKIKLSESNGLEGPIICLYVEPIPIADVPFTFKELYSEITQVEPNDKLILSEKYHESQKCVTSGCDKNILNSAAGFLNFSNLNKLELSTPINNLDCKTYNPIKVASLAEEFGIIQERDETSEKLCERVKNAINNKTKY